MDEHNVPTEPLPDISDTSFPASNQSGSIPGGRGVPPPFPYYPDSQQPMPVYPFSQAPASYTGKYPSYPPWPGTPPQTGPGRPPNATEWDVENTKKQRKRRRRFLPAFVSLFFFCVQLLLVTRFCIRFLSLSPDITWVNIVTEVSEVFVSPFRVLWFQIPLTSTLALANNIELYTLVAMLIYGVLSRLLVGILKATLKSR
jgi:hypothetical protein